MLIIMRKFSIILILLFVFFTINLNINASSYKYVWYNTKVVIPVGENAEDYKNIPYARLMVDGRFKDDAKITYSNTGDWLYFFEDINTRVIGEYKVWYKAYENTNYCPGTCTDYKCLITFCVVDEIAPEISILNSIIDVKLGNNSYDLNSNFIVLDNYDKEPIINVIHSIDFNKIGKYKVNIKAIDSSLNEANDYFMVNIYGDITPPTIKIIKDIVEIPLTATLYDPTVNVIVKDDSITDCEVIFTGNIEFGTLGDYKIDITAIDCNNNVSTNSFIVRIIDNSTAPTIKFTEIGDFLEIPLNSDINISDYFQAYDSISGDISDRILYPKLTTNQIGSYKYTVTVTNDYNKTSEYQITINIIDKEVPVIELTTHSLFLDYKTDFNNFNFKNYIIKISDDNVINENNLKIENNLENKVGSYYIRYTYSDGIHSAEEIIDVRLISYNKPIIETSYIEIEAGTTYDLLEFLIITDESDSYILDSVEIDDSNVNYDEAGTYYIKATAVNSSGLNTEKRIRVKVISGFSIDSITLTFIVISSILLIIIIVGSFTVLIIFKKKFR